MTRANDDEDRQSLRRATHGAAEAWSARAWALRSSAPEREASAETTSTTTLSEHLARARDDAALLDEHPELKRQRKLEETNDANRVWARGAWASAARGAPFLTWCETHFRHVDADDVAAVTPDARHDMANDGDYLIPPLGRHYVHGACARRIVLGVFYRSRSRRRRGRRKTFDRLAD